MSLEFYSQSIPKARKEHKCEMCRLTIEKGERYSYLAGKFEGEFFERKLHIKCGDILQEALKAMREDEFDYYMITDWWTDNKCSICKYRYPECDVNEKGCPYSGSCKQTSGRCKKDGINCDKMDRRCWCTLFEPEELIK
ncbi:MAG: hypothetical protein ACYCWE_21030 [Eubacteriales bacterium]